MGDIFPVTWITGLRTIACISKTLLAFLQLADVIIVTIYKPIHHNPASSLAIRLFLEDISKRARYKTNWTAFRVFIFVGVSVDRKTKQFVRSLITFETRLDRVTKLIIWFQLFRQLITGHWGLDGLTIWSCSPRKFDLGGQSSKTLGQLNI